MTDTRNRTRKTPRLVDAVAAANPKARAKAKVKKRGGGGGRRRWLRVLLGVGLGVAFAGLLTVGGIFLYYGLDPDLPRITNVSDYHPKVTTRVVDKNGELLGELFDERRTVVARDKIPPVMVHAIVDAEDAQFFEHKGLNYWGMLRAVLNNLRPGAHLQGASTITQQLVKTYLLKTNERTLKRKVQEAILARRLEAALTKDEILYIYLNQIYFGHLRYGVEEAARFFFGKSISDVNAGEAALLASLPKGPEEISPLKHPDRAKDRQRYVLSQMLRYGHISKAEADRYALAPIEVVKPPPFVATAPEFVDEARRAINARYGKDKLPWLGLTVKMTCDGRIEKLAREALEKQLENLDERQGYRKPLAHIKTVTAAAIKSVLRERSIGHLKKMSESPSKSEIEQWLERREHLLGKGQITEAVVVELRDDGAIVDAAPDRAFLDLAVREGRHDRYNPKGLPPGKRFSVGDVVTVRVEPSLGPKSLGDKELPIAVPEFGPQGALVALDPTTRDVVALIGGYGFGPGGFDRATMARRQPGSAFKPFLYATAFLSGKYTPASILNDSPQVFALPEIKRDWNVHNAEHGEFHGPVRLRTALAKSLNTVAGQLIVDLQPGPVAQTARLAGIESKLDETFALGLGASVVSPIEITNAYATFAAQGKRAAPLLIDSIGATAEPRPVAEQAIQPDVAYLMTSMMQSVIEQGTAASARGKLKRPAAGKTGTTTSERDAWFIGYTPDIVVGVWVGFDDMRDLGRGEQGARSALPIWIDVMNGALKGVPPKPFSQPPGVETVRIDPVTGLLAAPGATNGIDEVFLAGSAPKEQAPQAGEENPDTFLIDQPQ